MSAQDGAKAPLSGVEVIRAARAEFLVTDLERAREFYVELLGFVEGGRERDRIHLRGLEERERASLVLKKAPQPGASYIAYRVAEPEDLERLGRRFGELGLQVRRLEPDETRGPAIRVRDPAGLPVEFYNERRPAERLLQEFHLHRGPGIMRLDHFNCQVPDVRPVYDFYTQELGFRCTEYTESEGVEPQLWAAWLTRKHTVHDLALMNGVGPRLHHVGFTVPDALGILRACDILAGARRGEAIERGPGRHGLSNAMFLYLRDPDGNRIELYTGDYLTADPDAEPIRWSLEDPRRQTFWGHFAPECWFREAALVRTLDGEGFEPTREPLLSVQPSQVTAT
jgi:3,4-dihydroxyphenylacetate 2,3-dioxygenase